MPAATMGPRAERTSALIREHARDVFLAKGYFGTTIDDIADAAGVSRSSFYTYYPSKRDLLLALGANTFEALDQLLDDMQDVVAAGGTDTVADVVRVYLRYLDEHGAFMLVWGQAAFGDEQLRASGLRARLATSKRFEQLLERLGWQPEPAGPGETGLALLVMAERYWFYWRYSGLAAPEDRVVRTLADIISATIQAP
jgi:AcrR family transcriptional regulator